MFLILSLSLHPFSFRLDTEFIPRARVDFLPPRQIDHDEEEEKEEEEEEEEVGDETTDGS